MMKRGKDEKIMGPMFPRLHVNDTEKGGPRAPPRNKMALYEQLSIPTQRFNHSMLQNSTYDNLAPPSSQGSGNEMHKPFSGQLPPRNQSDVQYSPYTDFSTPLTQGDHRARSDEDDFRVPIFTNSFPSQEFGNNEMDVEKPVPSNGSYFNHMLNFPKGKDASMLESSMMQEGKNEMLALSLVSENNECLKRQISSSLFHEKGISPANSVEVARQTLRAESQSTSNGYSTAVFQKDIPATVKRNSAPSMWTCEAQNIVHDLSNITESRDCGYRGSMEPRNLEMADSLSETSILDSISVQDITPDDVVGIIGQKHFWRARRAIANQQRVFAVQLFELHRLIKVQRLIAASPTVLVEEAAYLHKPIIKALPMKKLPLEYPVKPITNISTRKVDPDKQTQNKEGSAENNAEKTSFSSAQNTIPQPGPRPLDGNSPAESINSDHHSKPWCFNNQPQPQGHQWLIPVMSPSEGLVYKPYTAPGFMGPSCGGFGPPRSIPTMGTSFLPPPYGIPGPHSHYQFQTFGPPHGYFPPYGMTMMNPATFSDSPVEQINHPPAINSQFGTGVHNQTVSAIPSPKSRVFPNASEDIEVQASTASSPSEVPVGFRGERRNVLKLFPTSPVPDSPNLGTPQPLEMELPTRVIRVVPHNARTATVSAARIFQSIQEERKQYDVL